jgi:hypothetical protein
MNAVITMHQLKALRKGIVRAPPLAGRRPQHICGTGWGPVHGSGGTGLEGRPPLRALDLTQPTSTQMGEDQALSFGQ